ncbi:MAG TPA: (Fe-S)-binding protein [Ignavibacteria bacterium]
MTNINFTGIDIPSEEFLIKCMHCGLCLPTCPTYQLTGLERNSPRGRIRLIKSVLKGKLEISKTFYDEMYFCLDCQACETACPAGVKYGNLVELARVQIDKTKYNRGISKIIKKFIFENIFISKKRVKLLARLLKFYQKSGLQYFVRKTKVLKLFSNKLYKIEGLAPRISDKFTDKSYPKILYPEGEIKYKVGFFYGCFMNVMFSDINSDTIDVLLKNGCQVIIPSEQECCGSMHAHNGDLKTARKLAKINIDAFLKYDLDFIIVNSAGCSAFMKEYAHILIKDDYHNYAQTFTSKVSDILEFLNNIEMKKPQKEILKRITYHDACHHVHTQKIYNEPRQIISKIQGLDFIEMKDSTQCCGSAGIYNIINYDDSMKILDLKLKNIANTKAEIVLVSNPGCLAQIRYGLEKDNINIQAIHPVTLLKESYKE